jgi:hypothetical protein
VWQPWKGKCRPSKQTDVVLSYSIVYNEPPTLVSDVSDTELLLPVDSIRESFPVDSIRESFPVDSFPG